MTMSIKICCVCNSDNSKYKCPKCRLFYCSSTCCSKHKENCTSDIKLEHHEPEQILPEKIAVKYDFPTEDTVPIEKLEQLRYSEAIKNCLMNPQVRHIITSVLQDENPTKAIATAMTESVFVELADECLKIVEVPDEEKPY